MQVAAWTRAALPDEHRRLLRRKADTTLDKAVTFVQSLQRGGALSERTFEALLEKLDGFDDHLRLQELGRLFAGVSLAVDMAVGGATTEATADAFEAESRSRGPIVFCQQGASTYLFGRVA